MSDTMCRDLAPARSSSGFRAGALALAGGSLLALASATSGAFAADLPTRAPAPDFIAPAATPGFSGPLSSIFAPLADRGFTFHVLALDFFQGNPSAGLQRGRGSNSTYIIVGTDIDLGKAAGLQGTYLHYENTFFANVHNLNLAGQIGDSQVGYQPPFNPTFTRLSRATIEQKLMDGKLDIEAGITHPDRFYAIPNCDSINSCFQDILVLNAGWSSPQYGVLGGNISYQTNSPVYVEAGAFAENQGRNQETGYDFNETQASGVIGMAEIGYKTKYDTTAYPATYSLTGFFNTQSHVDFNAASAFGPTRNAQGTSGVVAQAEQVVWRADGGTVKNATPTAISIYGSGGGAIDSTIPIESDVYIGAKLLAPFQNNPGTQFGVKFNWERLNKSYDAYLGAANLAAGGTGQGIARDKYIFEFNAHVALPYGLAFEPVAQYIIHPNSFFNPVTPIHPKDGFYLGGTVVVPVGVLLGIAAHG
ncbi:carbohydrate porin [Beijerinckia sp. L45]|uniref:carbohydrate porin n=1 Tax=Beijerinckia sp. L45 TaxID=1641855 RepID=UPI00131E2EB1|nr:carbohydrate porin [Beijerinckia sp. L45]